MSFERALFASLCLPSCVCVNCPAHEAESNASRLFVSMQTGWLSHYAIVELKTKCRNNKNRAELHAVSTGILICASWLD